MSINIIKSMHSFSIGFVQQLNPVKYHNRVETLPNVWISDLRTLAELHLQLMLLNCTIEILINDWVTFWFNKAKKKTCH